MFVGTFFVFRNSVEKLCVSWALSLVECVAVWALKLPVPHTDVLKPTSHKVFLRNYWNPKELATNIWHIHPKKQCCPSKRQLSPHLRNLTIKTRVLFHILFVEFHFHLLDANQFGIPVIYPEKFCRKWVQMRKYQACVFYIPILLRICPSGSAHYLQTFHDKLRNPKEYQQILCTNPPQCAILISIK